MPVTRSAAKKLRQDKKREKYNKIAKNSIKQAIIKFRQNPSEKSLGQLYSFLDRAKKKKIYHANKVARIKSALAKHASKKTVKTKAKPEAKRGKAAKKTK